MAIYRVHGTNFTNNQIESSINALKAATYIVSIIPFKLKQKFLQETFSHYLESNYKNRIIEDVYSTLSWKISKRISWMIFPFLSKKFRVKYKIESN